VLILACVALALLTAAFTGGRLSRLAAMPWRNRWLLPVALAAQTAVIELPGLPRAPSAVIHILTYLLAAAFLWSNRHIKALWLLTLGAASNGVTIALNGGTLPADPRALTMAGIQEDSGFVNSGPLHHPILGWLGDIFAVPHWLPLANVFSIGDVLIVAGAVWLIQAGAHAGPRQGVPPRTKARPDPRHWWLLDDANIRSSVHNPDSPSERHDVARSAGTSASLYGGQYLGLNQ
jgi:hypothetical protein